MQQADRGLAELALPGPENPARGQVEVVSLAVGHQRTCQDRRMDQLALERFGDRAADASLDGEKVAGPAVEALGPQSSAVPGAK